MAGLQPDSEYAVFNRITESYIKPRSEGLKASQYSMLLYGPQGTGKTDLAENLARCLGRVLISITPSDFIVGGGALVEARAQAIFDVLSAQTDAVILLDEIDRLILDRDSAMYRHQSDLFQFMTPGMLTKFRDLRRAERCIFIVSTNYAERIDPAIKRAGRIDDQYLVLPPDKKQRARIIRDELGELHWNAKLIPSDAELADVLSATVLFIPGELQKVTRQAIRSLKSGAKKGDLLDALKKTTSSFEPTVRLSSYRPRFRWAAIDKKKEDFESNQEPFTEFLMLVYLTS